jgi:7-carboxy-7-deazaguanine synthase
MALLMNEVFHSIQGEGRQAGLPTVFLRTSGCSLRCSWCDTAYAFWDGYEAPVDEVVEEAESYPHQRACVTGGEPLDQAETVDLLDRLLDRGWEVVLETSGGQPVDEAAAVEPREDLVVSLDVKLPSSGMEDRNLWGNLDQLEQGDQMKFVVGGDEDYAYALDVLDEHGDRIPCPVFFQPVYGTSEAWLADRVLEDGLDVRLSTQMHKQIWGDEPGH